MRCQAFLFELATQLTQLLPPESTICQDFRYAKTIYSDDLVSL